MQDSTGLERGWLCGSWVLAFSLASGSLRLLLLHDASGRSRMAVDGAINMFPGNGCARAAAVAYGVRGGSVRCP